MFNSDEELSFFISCKEGLYTLKTGNCDVCFFAYVRIMSSKCTHDYIAV